MIDLGPFLGAVADRVASQLAPVREDVAELRELLEGGVPHRRRLSRDETATHYDVSTRTVDTWLARGAPCLRLGGPGGSPRMDVVELDAWHREQSEVGR